MPNRRAVEAAQGFRDRIAGANQQLGDIARNTAATTNALLGAGRAASALFFTLQSIRLTVATLAFQGLSKVVQFIGQARRDGLSFGQAIQRAVQNSKQLAQNMAEASRHGKDGQQVTGGMARSGNLAQQAFGKMAGRTQTISRVISRVPGVMAGVVGGAVAASRQFSTWLRELQEAERHLQNIGRLSQQASATLGGDPTQPGSAQRQIRQLVSSRALGRLSEEQSGQLISQLSAAAPGTDPTRIAAATAGLARADLGGFDALALAGDTGAGLLTGLSGEDAAELAARAARSGTGGQVSSLVSSARRRASQPTLQALGPLLFEASRQGPQAVEALRTGLGGFIERGEVGDLRSFLGSQVGRLPAGQRAGLQATLAGGGPGRVIESSLAAAQRDPETRRLLAAQVTQAQAGRARTERLRDDALEELSQESFDELARERDGTVGRFFRNVPLVGRLRSEDVGAELNPFAQARIEGQLQGVLAESLGEQVRLLQQVRDNTGRRRLNLQGQR